MNEEPGLFIANIGYVGKSRKNHPQNPLGGSQVGGSGPDLGVVVGAVEPEDHYQSPRTFHFQYHRRRFREWVVGHHLVDLEGRLVQPRCFVQRQLHSYPFQDHRMT